MMSDRLNMLRRLNPPVRPIAGQTAAPRRPLETSGFEDLLTLVASNRIQSEQPVQIDHIRRESLTDEQQQRLSNAADAAQAAGFATALLLIDGRGFVLDVNDRRVFRELSAADDSRTVELDGAVYVPKEGEAAPDFPVPGLPQCIMPEHIYRQIQQTRGESAPTHMNEEPQPNTD